MCLLTFSGRVPPFNEYLNVNTPLQIGGLMAQQFDPLKYRWSHTPMGKPFEGCIKNIIHNSKLYDLAEPGLQLASKPGCLQLEDVCKTSFPGKGSFTGTNFMMLFMAFYVKKGIII